MATVTKLARGGMGEVFLIERPGDNKAVVKTVRNDVPASYRFYLQKEALLTSMFDHPNIIAYRACSLYDSDKLLLELEYIDGCPLRTLFRRHFEHGQTLSVPMIAHVARKVFSALRYLHHFWLGNRQCRIEHRDISPSNILIRRDGQIKLIDFGIASYEPKPGLGDLLALKGGKKLYSPALEKEDEAGDRRNLDFYSLGVVILEGLLGTKATKAVEQAGLLRRHCDRLLTACLRDHGFCEVALLRLLCLLLYYEGQSSTIYQTIARKLSALDILSQQGFARQCQQEGFFSDPPPDRADADISCTMPQTKPALSIATRASEQSQATQAGGCSGRP